MDEKNDYEQLNNVVVPHHKSGVTVGRFAAEGLLFLKDTDAKRRPVMCDMSQSFINVFPELIRLFLRHDGREAEIRGDNWKEYYLNVQDEGSGFNMDLHSSGKIPPVSLYFGSCWSLDDANVTAPLAKCNFHFPLPWLKRNAPEFINHFKTWCQILQPEQGTFGLSIVHSPFSRKMRTLDAWPYLARFSGLDRYTTFDWYAPEFHSGIRAVNWLTVLDNVWVDRLGGIETIRSGLYEEGQVHTYDGGIIVQASTHPQLGDINLSGVPEAYVAVDKLIAAHRFVDYPDTPNGLFKVPAPLDRHVTMLEWLRRFEPKAG